MVSDQMVKFCDTELGLSMGYAAFIGAWNDISPLNFFENAG